MVTQNADAYLEAFTAGRSLREGTIATGVTEPSRLFTPQGKSIDDITRLVVLVPEIGLRPGWWRPLVERLNAPDDIEIVLVALSRSDRKESTQRRRLSKLASPLQKEYPFVQSRLIKSADWAYGLQNMTKSHDLLVCFPEQQVVDGFFNRQPLSQALVNALSLPVIEILGAYPTTAGRLSALAKSIMFQAFPFLVVALFFWFQTQINHQTHDLSYQIALGATVVVELGLVFVWSLFLD